MIRATTPTHTFYFPSDIHVGDMEKIRVTYCQCCRQLIQKEKKDLSISTENNSIAVFLTQQELNLFKPEVAEIQVRVKDGGGRVAASQIIKVKVKRVLNSEVI